MDKDDLVFNEAVATGAVRLHLEGDRGVALSHLRAARHVLGQMRSTYGVNARIAAGEPGGYYRWYVQMPDGTRIDTVSNDGQDTVRIVASAGTTTRPVSTAAQQPRQVEVPAPPPAAPVPVSETSIAPPAEVEQQTGEPEWPTPDEQQRTRYRTRSVFVCGNTLAGQEFLPWMWRESDGAYFDIEMPRFYPIAQGWTAGVSGNGEVAGYIGYFDADGGGAWLYSPFVWSEQNGTQIIEADSGTVNAISRDGSVVVGTSFHLEGLFNVDGTPAAAAAWVRQPNGDYVRTVLPNSGAWAEAYDVSDDGTAIAYLSVRYTYGGDSNEPINHYTILRWTRDGGMDMLAEVVGEGASAGPMSISGNGSACAWDAYRGRTPETSFDAHYSSYWSETTGLINMPELFYPAGLSYRGDVVFGWLADDQFSASGQAARWSLDGGLELAPFNERVDSARSYGVGEPIDPAGIDPAVPLVDEPIEVMFMGSPFGPYDLLVKRGSDAPLLHMFSGFTVGRVGIADVIFETGTDTGASNEPV